LAVGSIRPILFTSRSSSSRAAALSPAAEDADIIVVNTCSVTSSADQATRQIVRKVARENPNARIVVTGCYATRRPDDVAGLAGAIEIVPNDRKDESGGRPSA
jgi:tRNA A37 methylthiotransferase MiaB